MSTRELAAETEQELVSRFGSSDGIFCVDAGQRISYWGPSAREILGYSPEDVLGRPCYEVVGGRDAQNFRFCRRNCPVATNARRGRPTGDYDVLTRAKDGSEVWVNMSILLLDSGLRRRPLVLHLFRDVTERRRVEGLARRAVEALGELGGSGAPPADTRPTPLPSLSRRELQVLQLLASGLTTEQIADALFISPITARNHVTHLVSKLGARNRLQAILYASRRGII